MTPEEERDVDARIERQLAVATHLVADEQFRARCSEVASMIVAAAKKLGTDVVIPAAKGLIAAFVAAEIERLQKAKP